MIFEFMRDLMRLVSIVLLGRRLRVEGPANVPPRGAALLVGNHVGAVDPVLLGITVRRRDIYFMAKSELFARPLMSWLFRHCHAFPVIRDSPDRSALNTALEHLRRGHLLVLYPEGTRADGGTISEPHAGAGFIARKAAVPLVPVATWGSDRVLPRGARVPRPASVTIRIGTPLNLPQRRDDGRPLDNRAASLFMMDAVRRLLPGAGRAASAAGPTTAA